MDKIKITPRKGRGQISMTVPILGGITTGANIPEDLGERNRTLYRLHNTPNTWEDLGDGAWAYTVTKDGLYSMTVNLTPHEDCVDVRISAKNLSQDKWEYTYTFTCFGLGGARAFTDIEMVRTYVYKDGGPKRIIEMDRTPSQRPLLQLYPIKGTIHCDEIAFIKHFRATCKEVADEGLMYIVSRDGKMVSGVAAENPLYLFNNAEYSCVHACPTLGHPDPGEEVTSLSRFYFLHGSHDELLKRVAADFKRTLTT